MKKHYSEVFGYYNSPHEIDTISKLAIDKKNALEIGSYIGKSSVAIAMNAKKLLCIDPFDCTPDKIDINGNLIRKNEGITILDAFLKNIEGYDNIKYIIGTSDKVIPKLTEKFDYIFIDGDHSFEGVYSDIKLCWPVLEINGIIAFHDYGDVEGYNMGIKKAFDMLLHEYDGKQDSVVWKIKKEKDIKL
jgi:predicted O-methyltransferase YrrM